MIFNFQSRITWKNTLQQFMNRWNLSKIERLGSWPKVSHISTTSNYSGSQSLSSIWEIQFSIFYLNFLKQNWKWNSKIERHGSWPKVSHISTTSNYSGSQTFSKFGDIQFSIKNNMKEHVAIENNCCALADCKKSACRCTKVPLYQDWRALIFSSARLSFSTFDSRLLASSMGEQI